MTTQLGQPLNLMLIEHQPEMVDKIKKLLSDPKLRYPHQVNIREFTVLADAYSRIPGDAWDIIIFSLDMPDSDGLPTFKKISAVSGAIPIIVIVEDFTFDIKEQLINAGAAACLRQGRVIGDPEVLPDAVDDVTREARKTETIDHLVRSLMSRLHLIKECARCRRWKHEGDEDYYPPHEYLEKFKLQLDTTGAVCPECSKIFRAEIMGSEEERLEEVADRPRRRKAA